MTNTIPTRVSIQFFVAAAFLAVFGFLNSSQYGTSLVPSLVLAAACVGAGLTVRAGTPNGRLVGLIVAAGTVAYGVISLLGAHYLPGSIVAGFVLVRLATSGAAFTGGAPSGPGAYQAGPYQQAPYPQQPYGQPTYGQAPSGQPVAGQPQYGTPTPGQPQYGQPAYGQPPAPPAPTAGDPRFG